MHWVRYSYTRNLCKISGPQSDKGSPAMAQSYDNSSASEVSQMDMEKIDTKQNKTQRKSNHMRSFRDALRIRKWEPIILH